MLKFASRSYDHPQHQHCCHHHCRHAADHQRQLLQLHHPAHPQRQRHLPAQLRSGHRCAPDARSHAGGAHHRRWPLRRGHHHAARRHHHQLRAASGRRAYLPQRRHGHPKRQYRHELAPHRRAEAGNGTVSSQPAPPGTPPGSFIFASNQGAGDTGAWGHLHQSRYLQQAGRRYDPTCAPTSSTPARRRASEARCASAQPAARSRHSGVLTIASGAMLNFSSPATITHTHQHCCHHHRRHAGDHQRQLLLISPPPHTHRAAAAPSCRASVRSSVRT